MYSRLVVPQHCRFLAQNFLKYGVCELLNEKTFDLFKSFFYEYCNGHLTSNVWSIVVEFLLHGFDYDAVAVKSGLFLGRMQEPIFAPVFRYFDKKTYMAFTVYNKNPGADKLRVSMTIFLPTNKSVNTKVIIVEDREFVCSTTSEIRNAANAWMYWLFSSAADDGLLM
jgi:hypothetical protein